MGQKLSLVICIGIPLAQGLVTGLASQKHIKDWYKKLKKPKWTPPNWFFAPVGSTLLTCMGIASWLIWRKGGFKEQCMPLTLYSIQLVLTAIWTPLFFNAHKVKLALADAVVLDGVTAATAVNFCNESKAAGYLMAPYLLYLIFVTAMNAKIVMDNPDADKMKIEEEVAKEATEVVSQATESAQKQAAAASGSAPEVPKVSEVAKTATTTTAATASTSVAPDVKKNK